MYLSNKQKNHAKGFILLAVLIFMQIFSCMSLYGLTSVFLLMKINRHSLEKSDDLIKVEKILTFLENKLINQGPFCTILITNPNQFVHATMAWWQQHVCSGNLEGMGYYYASEHLGVDDCTRIGNNTAQSFADYYRVTLLLLSKQGAKWLFQTTIVRPGAQNLPCIGKTHTIDIGRQMFRELI